MIIPVVAYGDPVLRKKTSEIKADYPHLESLLSNMWETMYDAHGVGLAAPQIGKAIRLFIIDASPFAQDEDYAPEAEELKTFKRVFINPKIIEERGEEWKFNEGCLSIPGVRQDVARKPTIDICYFDENFKEHTETLEGLRARVFQHEYDHIEGVLFTDKISPLKKRLVKGKLQNISKGKVKVDYLMKFPNKK